MARITIADIRRQEILDAELKVVSEKGYPQTTISDTAAELKMGHGTIYRLFKNEQEIASAVLDEVITRWGRCSCCAQLYNGDCPALAGGYPDVRRS